VVPETGSGPLDVAELHETGELRELADLLAAVWVRAQEPPLNAETLRALSHAGAYVSGARRGDRLVGGLVGFFGLSPDRRLTLHSHVLGVLEQARGGGVGYALKQHQRRWAAERGIETVAWTFDPLVRRNAHFNLVRLGAVVAAYEEDFYGPMDDAINALDPTDRLLVRWRVASPRSAVEADLAALLARGAAVALRVGPGGEPLAGAAGDGVRLCQVPEDIVALRRERPDLALAWRLALRSALGGALAGGSQVSGVARGGWYVLEGG
jgi:predicted GNAT superfamily acetyltransferase